MYGLGFQYGSGYGKRLSLNISIKGKLLYFISFHYISLQQLYMQIKNWIKRSYNNNTLKINTYALLCRPYSCIRKQTLLVMPQNIKQTETGKHTVIKHKAYSVDWNQLTDEAKGTWDEAEDVEAVAGSGSD